MAKLAMKRIEMIALAEDRNKILELLQRREIVEFVDDFGEDISKLSTSDSVAQFEKWMALAENAKTILDKYAPKKGSLLDAIYDRDEIEKQEFGKYTARSDEILEYCYDLIALKEKIASNKAELIKIGMQLDALKIWLGLDVPMSLKATAHTKCFFGVISKHVTKDELTERIETAAEAQGLLEIEIISSYKDQTCIFAVFHCSVADRVIDALREAGIMQPSEFIDSVPRFKADQLSQDCKRLEAEIEKAVEDIKAYSEKARDIEFFIDYMRMESDKYSAICRLGLTKNTFILKGYVPEKCTEKLIKELASKFTVSISVFTPEEDEDVPVLLENSKFSAPVESIVKMYALPAANDLDPSPYMAFFYYLFFGMMLSDAGYGLIMVIATAILLRKKNLKPSARKTLGMFFYCGISTVFWGAMFGSWFGDIVPSVANQLHLNAPALAIWFDPVKDPMRLLLFSFVLGMVHLFAALGVKFIMEWKAGQKLDAILDVFPTYLFVLGAAPLAATIFLPVSPTLTFIGKYMVIAGAISIVLTASRSSKNIFAKLGGGLYSLYGSASGYLGDVLSYSRLLALGLATGSIATVINLLGGMAGNGIVRVIVMLLVFLIGHSLNMAINLLGAYVHTNRLHFVEFFSKFYEGGGRPFEPLNVNTKYIKFKEEI